MIYSTKLEASSKHGFPELRGVALERSQQIGASIQHAEHCKRGCSHRWGQCVAEQVWPAALAQKSYHIGSACRVATCCTPKSLPKGGVDDVYLHNTTSVRCCVTERLGLLTRATARRSREERRARLRC